LGFAADACRNAAGLGEYLDRHALSQATRDVARHTQADPTDESARVKALLAIHILFLAGVTMFLD
jgi:hypothetical protein